MKIGAVIAEYNPFHNGHAYQVKKYKEEHQPDAVIAVMSEDFVQRGEPACTIYENRVRAALACGVDLVIGMPVWFSTASAGVFAAGGVSLLNACGCIDELFFGCDSNHAPDHLYKEMSKAAKIIKEEPAKYKESLSMHLHAGSHFALARSEALKACGLDSTMFDTPNNILGLSYISALKETNSTIRPILIQRKGSAYHDPDPSGCCPSASAIRQAWSGAKDLDSFKQITGIPPQTVSIYQSNYHKTLPITLSDYDYLFAMSLHEHCQDLLNYADMSADLANRILKFRNQYTSLDDFIDLVANRSLTKTRVKRACLHTMLGIDQILCQSEEVMHHAPYIRILGFRKKAASVLKEISTHASVPVITKPSEYKKYLFPDECTLFEKDINASLLYRTAARIKYHHLDVPHPFSSGVIIHRGDE